jgi:hypothetical protein
MLIMTISRTIGETMDMGQNILEANKDVVNEQLDK